MLLFNWTPNQPPSKPFKALMGLSIREGRSRLVTRSIRDFISSKKRKLFRMINSEILSKRRRKSKKRLPRKSIRKKRELSKLRTKSMRRL
jgi:hypothetical protein